MQQIGGRSGAFRGAEEVLTIDDVVVVVGRRRLRRRYENDNVHRRRSDVPCHAVVLRHRPSIVGWSVGWDNRMDPNPYGGRQDLPHRIWKANASLPLPPWTCKPTMVYVQPADFL